MATRLLEVFKIDEFAALHWRYDEEDFIEHQNTKLITKKRMHIYHIRKNPYFLCNAIKVAQAYIHQINTTLLETTTNKKHKYPVGFQSSVGPRIRQ
jgi:hypothetical protein